VVEEFLWRTMEISGRAENVETDTTRNILHLKRRIRMPIEPKRGCGYRKVNALYLVGTGLAVPCDMLPLELAPCPTCGFELPFTRNLMWISKQYINFYARTHHMISNMTSELEVIPECKCDKSCPICYPNSNSLERYGLMWVSQKFYTPESFIVEAQEMGVSKRIGKIPKGLVLGETWVLLAHKKVLLTHHKEPIEKPAIFYAFIPKRIEMLIWKKYATPKVLEKLKNKGITPVIVPDSDKAHSPDVEVVWI